MFTTADRLVPRWTTARCINTGERFRDEPHHCFFLLTGNHFGKTVHFRYFTLYLIFYVFVLLVQLFAVCCKVMPNVLPTDSSRHKELMKKNGSYAAMYKKQAMNYLAIENEEEVIA